MDLRDIVDLLMSIGALTIAFSVLSTNPIAAVCLLQFTVIILLQYESKRAQSLSRVRSLFEEYDQQVSLVKILLLLVAIIDLMF